MNSEDKSNPEKIDIVRAWKDEEYRNSLTPEQLAQLPPNPAGDVDLSEEELEEIAGGTYKFIRPGGGGIPQSIGLTCLPNSANLYCHIA